MITLHSGEDGGCAAGILEHAGALLQEARAGEKLALAWGCGAGLVADETRAAMSRLLKVLYEITSVCHMAQI